MRIEITTREPSDAGRVAPLLREYGIGRVNVTDTAKEADVLGTAAALRAAVPGLDVVTHAAAKHHDPHSFRSFLFRVEDDKLDPLLVVSGRPRGKFDSLAALAMMSAAGGRMSAYCVHNPFLPDADRATEDARLAEKLGYPFVRGIVLQIGMDAERVKDAAARIRSLRPDAAVIASVPVPTDGMLKKLKERPLAGVGLDAAYLGSSAAAKEATARHLDALRGLGVEPLFFMDAFERDRIEWAVAAGGNAPR
ncbi:MAG TPA: hypothetical protein VLC10_00255 [Patescibacteria group bacterium]|nr:hypothetical protein [Patescibacteria group bacterium]